MKTAKAKQKLIILSDLWGKEKSKWIAYYTEILGKHFDITYYDCCELGGIDKSEYSEESLHRQFVSGGIDMAVTTLLEKESNAANVLAFSIGGTIAWKASLLGLKTKSLIAVSATRLRYETEKPLTTIDLLYGTEDPYKPDSDWFQNMGIEENFIENEGHGLYQKKEVAELICRRIIDRTTEKISNSIT